MPLTHVGRGRATIVRGGSWNNNQDNARCAYRNRNNPWNDNNNLGFRVMVSIALRAGKSRHPAMRGGARKPAWPDPGRTARVPTDVARRGRPNS